jgi:hypothetical protein
MALGPEPADCAAGPFAIRVNDGLAFLVVRGTGMSFTACLSAAQLRQLASASGLAASLLEATPAAASGANVVPLFGATA